MVRETAADTWFGNIWKNSRKSISWEPERPVVGILAFEISRLMSKVVSIWQSLADGRVARLREEIANSVGIQKLVSEDVDYLMDLVLAEIVENLRSVAKSVIMFGKKCTDSAYHNLERIFDDVVEINPKWYGWQFKLKKMEKKVKKMERFVAATEQLFQELEVLVELEQNLRRMRAGADSGGVKLLEYQQKVVWQRQEVKNLREMSPWVRTYDYIVRLLLRSILTIVERIKTVYGTKQSGNVEGCIDYEHINSDCLVRSNSIAIVRQVPVYASQSNSSRFAVPLGRSFSNLGLGGDKSKSKNIRTHRRSESSLFSGKQHPVKARIFAPAGLTGCMTRGSESPVVDSCTPSCGSSGRPYDVSLKQAIEVKNIREVPVTYGGITSTKFSIFNSKRHLLDASASTLGYAALALHYANVIILIEKLASALHLISLDARDDLYYMLPASIKSCLRAKLKTFSRTSASCFYDAAFAAQWSLAITTILDWLSPLAHNMVRWQSERNFERQRLVCGLNIHLVQTLYFANQGETEAAIVELLMGLNYLSRFGRVSLKPFQESSCSQAYDGYVLPSDNMYYKIIDDSS
ncbi:protein PSK SIMULATOR 3-like [Salvia miltiorrhiza]|uniref:protein PSK SIMULATOR 3-like n=1 Tax=Salvia miltiorrhiza TaxID=226208 RepID=UPI0025AD7A1B|nr:protein PSK SIMULATOR 3-like [Salvia miltiorrhiza]XP_057785732.1 protein PSK SIMULATOR 3-like [Salvia miltiorrhiza]XP_057785733.1 protein PSK SIMULATOR 3-like [Salvia miltiorrhiza]